MSVFDKEKLNEAGSYFNPSLGMKKPVFTVKELDAISDALIEAGLSKRKINWIKKYILDDEYAELEYEKARKTAYKDAHKWDGTAGTGSTISNNDKIIYNAPTNLVDQFVDEYNH